MTDFTFSINGPSCLLIAHWHYADLAQASGLYLIGIGSNSSGQIVQIVNNNIDFTIRVNSNGSISMIQGGQNRVYTITLIELI